MLLPPVYKLKAGKRLYTATGPNLYQASCWIWEVTSTSRFISWPVSANCSMPKFLERDKQMGQERTELWLGLHSCRNNIWVHLFSISHAKNHQTIKTPHSILDFWWANRTNSYLRVREVYKIQIKSRDTSKSYVCFVYDVSSVFWWGNIVSEMQISLRLGCSLCFLSALGHLTIFPEDEAWRMRLHISFCIYFFQSSFSDARSIKVSTREELSIALTAAPWISPAPNKWYILVHLFSL